MITARITSPEALTLEVSDVRLIQGPKGKSAYEAAVEGGYTGTEAEFNALQAALLEAKTAAAASAEVAAASVAELEPILGDVETLLEAI